MFLKPKRLVPFALLISVVFSSCLAAYVIAVDAEINKAKAEVDTAFVHLIKPNHPDFQDVDVPEEMENYSAVVLSRNAIFKYEARGFGGLQYQALRMQIKLQDKSALESFSEFYYPENAKANFRLIKGGSKEVVTVDPEEAVTVEETDGATGGLYSWASTSKYNKLAIPGLEVGDVVDFAFISHDISTAGTIQVWPEINFGLVNEYPVVKQKIDFTMGENIYVNTASLNGAPEFKKTQLSDQLDLSDKQASRLSRYVLEDGQRLPMEAQYWASTYRELPMVRFQVAKMRGKGLARTAGDNYPFFFQMPQRMEDGVDGPMIKRKISEMLDNKASNAVFYYPYYPEKSDIKHIEKELRPRTSVDKARIAYYYLRAQLFTDIIGEEGYSDEISTDVLADNRLHWYDFYNAYRGYLEELDVPYSVLIYAPRTFGSFDDILTFNDFEIIFAIQSRSDIYIARNPTFYSNFGSAYYSFDHSDYESISGRRVRIDFKEYSSTMEDNSSDYKLEVSLTNKKDAVKVSRDVQYNGYSRLNHWYDLVTLEDYYEHDLDFLKLESPEQRSKKKYISKIKSDRKQVFEELRKEQTDYHLKEVNGNYDIEIEEVDHFELVNDGRYEDEPVLHFKDAFTTSAFLQQVGSNLILDVGAMIGGQLELEEEDMERSMDIYLSYPQTLNYTINVTIPEGYEADGLDALNISTENETGGFISSAELKEDQVVVSVKKFYKTYMEPASNWSLMTDFLEAAYDFTQKKVVLKKVAG